LLLIALSVVSRAEPAEARAVSAVPPLRVGLLSETLSPAAAVRELSDGDNLVSLLGEGSEGRNRNELDLRRTLERCDVALVALDRLTANQGTVEALCDFLRQGKGLVVLRSVGETWAEWPGFDAEILGIKQIREAGQGGAVRVPDPDHPVLTGALEIAPEATVVHEMLRPTAGLDVFLEIDAGNGPHPLAWTTWHERGSIVYLGISGWGAATQPALARLVTNALHWVGRRPVPAARLRIERVLMKDSAPSPFAIGFTNGVNVCYDPVQGGLNYVWENGFIVMASNRPGVGKDYQPAPLLGPLVYQEGAVAPLRRGAAQPIPARAFKGYRLRRNAVEFVYTIDGSTVAETVGLDASGRVLVRRFRVHEKVKGTPWWYVPARPKSRVLGSPNGTWDATGFRFQPDDNAEFILEVALRPSSA